MSPGASSPPAASATSARSARLAKRSRSSGRSKSGGGSRGASRRVLAEPLLTEGVGSQFQSAPGIAGLFSSLLLLVQPAMILHT